MTTRPPVVVFVASFDDGGHAKFSVATERLVDGDQIASVTAAELQRASRLRQGKIVTLKRAPFYEQQWGYLWRK